MTIEYDIKRRPPMWYRLKHVLFVKESPLIIRCQIFIHVLTYSIRWLLICSWLGHKVKIMDRGASSMRPGRETTYCPRCTVIIEAKETE